MILWKVLFICFGFQTILNSTRPIITLYASDLGASTFDIGLLTAAYAFFPLIFAIYAGRIADKVGDKIPVLFGLIGISIGMLVPIYFQTMWSLYVSQLIVGTATVFITVSLQNILGNASTEENRDQYYSFFSIAVAFGALVGPVLGGYIGEYASYTSVFRFTLFFNLLPILIAFFIPVIRKQAKSEKAEKFGSSIRLLKTPLLRKALFSSALVLYSKDIFIAYFPLFAKQYGISTSTIGWIIAIQGLATILVRLFLPKLTEKFGRDYVLIGSVFVAGISFLIMPFTGNIILLGMLSALMGFGLGCGQPLSMTTTYNASPKSRTGEVLGLRLATNRLSQLIAPVFFGIVGSWAGVLSVFFISGTFLIGGLFAIKPEKETKIAS